MAQWHTQYAFVYSSCSCRQWDLSTHTFMPLYYMNFHCFQFIRKYAAALCAPFPRFESDTNVYARSHIIIFLLPIIPFGIHLFAHTLRCVYLWVSTPHHNPHSTHTHTHTRLSSNWSRRFSFDSRRKICFFYDLICFASFSSFRHFHSFRSICIHFIRIVFTLDANESITEFQLRIFAPSLSHIRFLSPTHSMWDQVPLYATL